MLTDEELKEIFASAPVANESFEVLEIDAPWFKSEPYYIQNMDVNGIDVRLESGDTVTALYAPASITRASSNNDLNYERKITLQDVNDIIANELDNFKLEDWQDDSGALVVKSREYVIYRDGTVSNLKSGPVKMVTSNIDFSEEGASFSPSTKPVNVNATGERFTTTRFKGLKGFL